MAEKIQDSSPVEVLIGATDTSGELTFLTLWKGPPGPYAEKLSPHNKALVDKFNQLYTAVKKGYQDHSCHKCQQVMSCQRCDKAEAKALQKKKPVPRSQETLGADIITLHGDNKIAAMQYQNLCTRCAQSGHYPPDCPHLQEICHQCGKKGHLIKACAHPPSSINSLKTARTTTPTRQPLRTPMHPVTTVPAWSTAWRRKTPPEIKNTDIWGGAVRRPRPYIVRVGTGQRQVVTHCLPTAGTFQSPTFGEGP
jgi:hypothetical protein